MITFDISKKNLNLQNLIAQIYTILLNNLIFAMFFLSHDPKKVILACLLLLSSNDYLNCQNLSGGKNIALFFVGSKYEHDWSKLDSSLAEVIRLKNELTENFNFEAELFPNLTKQGIQNKLLEYSQKTYSNEDQLFIYFSMHGFYDSLADRGYLIPYDGKHSFDLGNSWLSYDDLKSALLHLPVKHLLIGLDACYSGAFGNKSKDGGPVLKPWELAPDCQTRVRKILTQESRLFFSAGSKTEKVPTESRFLAQLLNALKNGVDNDGLLTCRDIWSFLDKLDNPSPEFGSFGKGKDGEFIFIRKNSCSFNNSDEDLETKLWEKTKKENTEEGYDLYLSTYTSGKFVSLAKSLKGFLYEQKLWKAVEQNLSVNGLSKYLEIYPSGRWSAQARTQLDALNNPSEFIFIKGGRIKMGCNKGKMDEIPRFYAEVDSFYLGRIEVSYADYCTFLNEDKSITDVLKLINYLHLGQSTRCHIYKKENKYEVEKGFENYPVSFVSWFGAQAYCKWLSNKTGILHRLPTEAEWEYASRHIYLEEDIDFSIFQKKLSFQANHCEELDYEKCQNTHNRVKACGSLSSNELGFYDLWGNVNEWCSDWYETFITGDKKNPIGPKLGSYKVIRGGSFKNTAYDCRSTARFGVNPNEQRSDLGFRVVRQKK